MNKGTFHLPDIDREKIADTLRTVRKNAADVTENVAEHLPEISRETLNETIRTVRKGAGHAAETVKNSLVWSGYSTLPRGRAPETIVPGCAVLEGGSFRGNYTSGVLDVLMENGINLQCTVGTSAGALNGLNYTAGEIGRSIRINLGYRHDPRYIGVSAVMGSKCVIGLKFMIEDIIPEMPFDFERFDRPDRRFVVTATDCNTGLVRYYEKGHCCEILKAVRASASLPYVSGMVRVEGTPCLDGGLAVKIPYQWAIDQGYSKILVIRTREKTFRRVPESRQSRENARRAYPNHPRVAEGISLQGERYNAACDELDRLSAEGRVCMLCPSEPITVSAMEGNMDRLAEVYFLGRRDAEARLEEIKAYLGGDAQGVGELS